MTTDNPQTPIKTFREAYFDLEQPILDLANEIELADLACADEKFNLLVYQMSRVHKRMLKLREQWYRDFDLAKAAADDMPATENV